MKRATLQFAAALVLFAARPVAASVPTETVLARPDQQAFAIITTRNIFDPSRTVLPPPPPPPPAQQEFLVLKGTMSFDGQTVAFVAGSRPQFSRALKPADNLAGFTVARITGEGITLIRTGEAALTLGLNSQLRQLPDGSWSVIPYANPN